jgi:hypothetical protein
VTGRGITSELVKLDALNGFVPSGQVFSHTQMLRTESLHPKPLSSQSSHVSGKIRFKSCIIYSMHMSLDSTEVLESSTTLMYLMREKSKTPAGYLTFDQDSGWIRWISLTQSQDGNAMLCWLPVELRGDQFANYEGVFVVASRLTHQLTIIDFNPMLNGLYDMGLIV